MENQRRLEASETPQPLRRQYGDPRGDRVSPGSAGRDANDRPSDGDRCERRVVGDQAVPSQLLARVGLVVYTTVVLTFGASKMGRSAMYET